MQRELQRNNIVLLGIGHTNAHVVRKWRMSPIGNANLICVSDSPIVTYSGMLPGALAEQYRPEQMEIDLVRWCAVSQCRLIMDHVAAVDLANRELVFAERPPLRFDWLSIGIGSRPATGNIDIADPRRLLSIKPMQTFLPRLDNALQRLTAHANRRPAINVIGGGVAGIEIAFCLYQRLQTKQLRNWELRVITGSPLGQGLAPVTVHQIRNELEKRGIRIWEPCHVDTVSSRAVRLDDGRSLDSDLSLLVSGAVAGDLLRDINLPHDPRGFLLTRATLQSTGDRQIFAVGDSGTLESNPVDKAGVFAVRQGPVLWHNLKQAVLEKPLRPWRPQRQFLKLINLGDGQAIADYRGRSVRGRWVWGLKDRIDRGFVSQYQDYRPARMNSGQAAPGDQAGMRCLGCGGKLGSLSLRQAFQKLQLPQDDRVLTGLQNREDAAVVRVGHSEITCSTDFFAAPLNDPYLNGRIAALNSASDCFVMNARVTCALTLAQIPYGHHRSRTDVLTELMAGAAREFQPMGASIVGGHTIEGPRLLIGFTVLGESLPVTGGKAGLVAGDQLVLTKPLGTGILLAGLMRGMCRAAWYSRLVETMLVSNQVALLLRERFDISAMTDVTGFGLAGHLQEMLDASQVSAELSIGHVPVLPGTLELLGQGIESTLAPENRDSITGLTVDSGARNRQAVLFDPQTAGGLLLGVSPEQLRPLLEFLLEHDCPASCRIGQVLSHAAGRASEIHVIAGRE